MGRELRRVPLDFDWPLRKTWSGFLMPKDLELPTCPDCGGGGLTREARAISDTFYPHQIRSLSREHEEALAWHDKIGQAEVDNLIAHGRLTVLKKREPTPDNPRDWEWVSVPRTADEINALNRRGGLDGHDSINHAILVQFRCERLGIRNDCARCNGNGDVATQEQRKAYDSWKGTQPPTGDGWQVWETVSEGSPVSPVCPTKDALIAWLQAEGYSESAARNFAAGGFAPSMVFNTGTREVLSDIESCR